MYQQALAQPDLEQHRVLMQKHEVFNTSAGGLLIWGFINVPDAASVRAVELSPEQKMFASWRFDGMWVKHA